MSGVEYVEEVDSHSEGEWVSHETLPVRNDRLIEFWVSYRSSLLSSPKVGESCIAL